MKTAIVVGGGMAGLFAANVLADHCEQVTVLERDEAWRPRSRPTDHTADTHSLPQAAGRPGVPQSRHVHVLLLRGVQVLRERFPGLEEELLALGATPLSWLKDTAALAGGSWLPRFDSNLLGYSVSRALLESQVREHLRSRGNIQFRTGHRVVGLSTSRAQSSVKGGRESEAGANGPGVTGAVCAVGDETVTLHAELVVDASGRSSRLPRWLEELGYAAPEESTVNADVGYATRWYSVPEDWRADWKMVLLATRFPDIKGGAVVQPVEGRRWVVTLVGYAGDHPPTDEAGFEEFARRLIGPQVWEAISAAEPLSDIGGYRRTENHWRHYERLKRWPQGVIALGDSVCAFNPVYAQGMTVGALSAEILDDFLKRGGNRKREGLESARIGRSGLAFQKKLAKMLQTPWQLATSDDFRWAGRKAGDAGPVERFMHRYIEHVLDRIHRPDVCLAFFNAAHLISPPATLFRPRIAVPILWEMLRNGSVRPVSRTSESQEPKASSL
ncbi:MAG: hypothetical protein OXF50_05250 [Caldilineaceae bacterium]|nr:hypothetical protein [Caldilineaceae bacterium]